MDTIDKLNQLKNILSGMGQVIIAYSGGVDSSLLLKVAHDCLGDGAVALTAVSASLPANELAEAREVARQIGAPHVLLDSHETDDSRYLENTPSRCYFCKSEVYDQLAEYARSIGVHFILDGTNADDDADHRPGRQAAREHSVRSPLLESGLGKDEIRQLARELGLSNWDKPAAACLSSRLPYGTAITLERLSQVEQAELVLRRLGIRQVRVRHHQDIARIEVQPEDFSTILINRQPICQALEGLGYTYIALDLAGFQSGSLNKALNSHGR